MLVKISYFILLTGVLSAKFKPSENLIRYSYKTNFIKNLLYKYNGFQIIFHVDNISHNSANEFLRDCYENNPISVTIYNHDILKISSQSYELQRVNVVYYLNNPTKLINYLKYAAHIIETDIIIFIVEDFNLQTFASYWFMRYLQRARNILFLNDNDKIFKIYKVCFYCGVKSGQLDFIQNVKSDEVNLSPSFLFQSKVKDFNGHKFKVGFSNYYPYVFCAGSVPLKRKTKCKKVLGLEIELLKVLSSKLNFTYRLIKYSCNNQNAIAKKLSTEKYDFVIGGISITPTLSNLAEFSCILRIEDIIVTYIPKFSLFNIIYIFLLPFSLHMWIGLIVSTLTISVFSFFILYGRRDKEITLRRILQVFLKSLLEQPINTATTMVKLFKTKLSLLLILSSWFLFCLLIDTTYKSRLLSLLVYPPIIPKMQLEDLLKEGYDVVVNKKTFSEIYNSYDLQCLNSTQLLLKKESLCDCVEYVKNHKTMIIEQETRLLLHYTMYCPIKNHMEKMFLHFFLKNSATSISKTMLAWPFKRGTPFINTFNKNINLIFNAGLAEKWKHSRLYSHQFPHMRRNRRQYLKFHSYVVFFLLYASCILICFFIFLFEILYKLFQRRQNRLKSNCQH